MCGVRPRNGRSLKQTKNNCMLNKNSIISYPPLPANFFLTQHLLTTIKADGLKAYRSYVYLVMNACFSQSTRTSAPRTVRQSGARDQKLSSFQPYSFMVCRTTTNSRANRWNLSRTSEHDTWNETVYEGWFLLFGMLFKICSQIFRELIYSIHK